MDKKTSSDLQFTLYMIIGLLVVLCVMALGVLLYVLGRQSAQRADAVVAAKSASDVARGTGQFAGNSAIQSTPAPTVPSSQSPANLADKLTGTATDTASHLIDAVSGRQKTATTPPAPAPTPQSIAAASALVGKWKIDQGDDYIEFFADGTMYETGLVSESGTYQVPEEGKLVETFKSAIPLNIESSQTYSYKIHGDELILTNESSSAANKYNRAR